MQGILLLLPRRLSMVLVSATSAVPTWTPRQECAGSRKYFDTGGGAWGWLA